MEKSSVSGTQGGTDIENDVKNGKKRSRVPEQWVKNVKKMRRNSGMEYISSKGHVVTARRLPSEVRCFILLCLIYHFIYSNNVL